MYYFLKQAHIKNKNPLAEQCKKQELPDWTKEAAPSAPLEEIPADCSCSETLSASFSLASANPKLKKINQFFASFYQLLQQETNIGLLGFQDWNKR